MMLETKCEVETISKTPSEPLPKVFDDVLSNTKKTLAEMEEEAPDPVIYETACHEQLLSFAESSPGDIQVGMAVCCAARPAFVSGEIDGKKVIYQAKYYIGRYLPSGGLPIYRVVDSTREEAGRLDRYGRMGGPFGWDKFRDLVAGALASFRHNFIALLLGFFRRPLLPLSKAWVLPNMVLAETRAPNQFVPPASFQYNLIRPAINSIWTIEISSPTDAKIGLDWWDSKKRDLARLEEVKISKGDSKVKVILTSFRPMLARKGYFTINPIDAPKGLTIKKVTTTPPCGKITIKTLCEKIPTI